MSGQIHSVGPGDQILNSFKSRDKVHWRDEDSNVLTQKIHNVYKKPPKLITGKDRESHQDSLIQDASKYRFPSPPTPVPIGYQAMHPCFACVRPHEKDPSVLCIKGPISCERCTINHRACNQDGQAPLFQKKIHRELYNYRLALAFDSNRWPVRTEFRKGELKAEFYRDLHSMRADIIEDEEQKAHENVTFARKRAIAIPSDESRAVQLYNYECQSIAKYSQLRQHSCKTLERIKARYPESLILGNAEMPSTSAVQEEGNLVSKQLNAQPDNQILLYPEVIVGTEEENSVSLQRQVRNASSAKKSRSSARTSTSRTIVSESDEENIPARTSKRLRSSTSSSKISDLSMKKAKGDIQELADGQEQCKEGSDSCLSDAITISD